MCVYLSLQLWDSFRDGAPCPPPPPGSSKGPLITVLNKPGLSLTPTCCVYFCTGCHNSVQGGSSAWGWKPSRAPCPGSHQSFQKTQQCPFLTPWTLQEVPFMERRGRVYLPLQAAVFRSEKKKKKKSKLNPLSCWQTFCPEWCDVSVTERTLHTSRFDERPGASAWLLQEAPQRPGT